MISVWPQIVLMELSITDIFITLDLDYGLISTC